MVGRSGNERGQLRPDDGVKIFPALSRAEHAVPPQLQCAHAEVRRSALDNAAQLFHHHGRRVCDCEPDDLFAEGVELSERILGRATADAHRLLDGHRQ